MGRPRQSLNQVAGTREVRAKLKQRTLADWEKRRLNAVLLGLSGDLTLTQIASECDVSPRTVGEWFEQFRKGGVPSLLTRKEKGRGPASWLDDKAMTDLKAELKKGKWHRAEDARVWLQHRLNRDLSLVVVYKYLGKIATRRSGVFVPRNGEKV